MFKFLAEADDLKTLKLQTIRRQRVAFRPGTRANLRTQIAAYLKFCMRFQLTDLPARPENLALYAEYLSRSSGSIDRKLDCSARFGPSSDQWNLSSVARPLPSDDKNKHNQTAAILKDTCYWRDTL